MGMLDTLLRAGEIAALAHLTELAKQALERDERAKARRILLIAAKLLEGD